MQVLKWKLKKLFGIILVILFLYLWLRPRKFNHKAEIKIQKIHPSVVWEFIADFSNMIKLNPTIVDFGIISESGNFEHWKYKAKYTEKLSHWPYFQNRATADFSVHSNWRKDSYFVNSTHTTCFFVGMYCLQSDSVFKFSLVNNINVGAVPDTLVEEIVNYGCPPFMYLFCKREVVYQRKHILANLYDHFLTKK